LCSTYNNERGRMLVAGKSKYNFTIDGKSFSTAIAGSLFVILRKFFMERIQHTRKW